MIFWIIIIALVILWVWFTYQDTCKSCGDKIKFNKRLKFQDGYVLDEKCTAKIGLKIDDDSKKWASHTPIQKALDLITEGKQVDEKEVIDMVTYVNRMEQTGNNSASKSKNNKSPHCPKCGSHNIQVVGNHRKSFSVGKAVVGGALTGGVGTLAGFAGKKGKKTDMICMNCGNKFKY